MTEARVYQQKRDDGLTETEWLAKTRAWNDALPGEPPAPVFNPSGLVPYPCLHGIATKPARYPHTKMAGVWLDAEGNERPPYGGQSWGRSRHLRIKAFGGRDGVPYMIPECVFCAGEPEPDDFYTAADGTSLR